MKIEYQKVIEALGSKRVKANESLASYTTFKIGGPADLFYEAEKNEEVLKAISLAKKFKVTFFILGKGSNLLINDAGLRGLVIRMKTFGCRIVGSTLVAEAGTPSAYVLQTALKNDLTGLEFLSGVPGSIGGAVVCNARAHFLGNFLKKPICVGDVLSAVTVLSKAGDVKKYSGKHYSYTLSETTIKKSGDVVLSVEFKLRKSVSQKAIRYLEDYEQFRKDKPYQKFPTPGSIFQNPEGKSAGWLIDQSGLKGTSAGEAQISLEHGNFIINKGKAKAKDVLKLIDLAKKLVFKKFGLRLKEEIVLVGFDKNLH